MEESIEVEQSFTNNQVSNFHLPEMATLEYSPLEQNLLKSNIVASIVFFMIPILIISVLKYLGVEGPLVFIQYIYAGLFVLMMLSIIFSYFAFYKKSYALRERDIVFNSGLFWKSSTAIPFNRVQHCEVTQGPIDRFYKLSHLKIFTAGGSSSDLSIEGLSPENANRIKDFIVAKTVSNEEE